MPENNLTADEIVHALEVCASGDEEACLTCHYGKQPGADCCGKLLEDAAKALKAKA